MHDCLAKDQFIDALKDREIRMKIRESASKTLDEAVVEPCRSRQCTRLSVGAQKVDCCDQEEKSKFAELLKQNMAAISQMVQFVSRQHNPQHRTRMNVNKMVGDWGQILKIT